MTYFPDMGCESMVASGPHVRAVGWLHPAHAYAKGEVPAAFLSRLREFVGGCGVSAEALYFGAFGGIHTCEFCGKAHGVGNFGVPSDDLLFIAPEMILHYIELHGYQPPAEFISAVLRSPFPDTEDYQLLTEPFWHMHRAHIQELVRNQQAADDAV